MTSSRRFKIRCSVLVIAKRARSEDSSGYCRSLGSSQRHWQDFRKTSLGLRWSGIGDGDEPFCDPLCRGRNNL